MKTRRREKGSERARKRAGACDRASESGREKAPVFLTQLNDTRFEMLLKAWNVERTRRLNASQ